MSFIVSLSLSPSRMLENLVGLIQWWTTWFPSSKSTSNICHWKCSLVEERGEKESERMEWRKEEWSFPETFNCLNMTWIHFIFLLSSSDTSPLPLLHSTRSLELHFRYSLFLSLTSSLSSSDTSLSFHTLSSPFHYPWYTQALSTIIMMTATMVMLMMHDQ